MKKKLRVRAQRRNAFAPPGLRYGGTFIHGFRCAPPVAKVRGRDDAM